jgi:hypothetical protein
MAFPTTSVLDDFNRADGALGTNWSTLSGGAAGNVATNQWRSIAGGGGYSETWWNPASFTNTQEVFCTVTALAATGASNQVFLDIFQGWSTSSTAALSGYQLVYTRNTSNDQLQIFKYTNGAFAQLGTTTTLAARLVANDKLGFERTSGGVLTGYTNQSATWSSQVTTTDAAGFFSGGQAANLGIGAFDSAIAWRLDDFGGGQTVAATVALPEVVMAPRIPTY